jgi:hypothetical protein
VKEAARRRRHLHPDEPKEVKMTNEELIAKLRELPADARFEVVPVRMADGAWQEDEGGPRTGRVVDVEGCGSCVPDIVLGYTV